MADAGFPASRHVSGIAVKRAFAAVKTIVTSGTGALPGAAASSLRLNRQVDDSGSPEPTCAGVDDAQAPSSSYTVAAAAGWASAAGANRAPASTAARATMRGRGARGERS